MHVNMPHAVPNLWLTWPVTFTLHSDCEHFPGYADLKAKLLRRQRYTLKDNQKNNRTGPRCSIHVFDDLLINK